MANDNLNNQPVKGDDLLAYLNKELSKADKHKLEGQMLEDEFLADAAEGLGMVKNKAALATNIAAINASLSTSLNKTAAAGTRSFLSVVGNTAAIAASVTLLVVAAYFLSKYSSGTNMEAHKSVADNPKVNSQPQFAPLNDGSVVSEESSANADSVINPLEKPVKNITANKYIWTPNIIGTDEADLSEDVTMEPTVGSATNATNTVEMPIAPVASDIDLSKYGPASNNAYNNDYKSINQFSTVSGTKEKAKPEKKNKNRSEDVITDNAPGVYMDGILIKKDNDDKDVADSPTRSVLNDKKAPPTNDATTKAMDLYKNGDYRGAINELDYILKEDPTNVKALYYSGMANKYLGKESKALNFYSKVPKNNPLYENAQWEKAQIYKSQKNNAQAITALQEVVNFNGTLKIRAQNMIKELGGTNK